jgi:hypothetical protein
MSDESDDEVVKAVSTLMSVLNSLDPEARIHVLEFVINAPTRSLAAANPPRSGTVSRSQTMTLGFMQVDVGRLGVKKDVLSN